MQYSKILLINFMLTLQGSFKQPNALTNNYEVFDKTKMSHN